MTPPEIDPNKKYTSDIAAEIKLPFSKALPIFVGALTGLLLRIIFFGKPGNPYAAMMASFIYLCPMLVGATTVYIAERQSKRTYFFYVWASGLASCLFVLGALAILVEGLICGIIIMPLFIFIGAFGGLVMGVVCRATNWPTHAMYSFAVLPLIFGGLESELATPSKMGQVERSVLIQSPPNVVWRHIMDARDIKPEEMDSAWIFRIGVPLPLAGVLQQTPDGLVRKITMGKDVHFDQVFTAWQENRYAHMIYRLYKDSFPPYALDDHVVVGGYYFDVGDTSYELEPIGTGTLLRIKMGYRVTTQFNWYTEPLARFMLGNFEEVVLNFYRRRSQAPSVQPGS